MNNESTIVPVVHDAEQRPQGLAPGSDPKAILGAPRVLSMQEAAQAALDVQDACNLSGVAHTFLQAIAAVNEEAWRLGKGTTWRNEHPVVQLFLCKMMDLAGLDSKTIEAAFLICEALARKD